MVSDVEFYNERSACNGYVRRSVFFVRELIVNLCVLPVLPVCRVLSFCGLKVTRSPVAVVCGVSLMTASAVLARE